VAVSVYFYGHHKGWADRESEMQAELDHCFTHRVRHSFRPTSVMSRDEILGMVYLDPRLADRLIMDDFNFSPYPIPKFNLVTLIKQLKEVKGKHRNYFWQNNLDQIYRFAFSLPLQDRAFVYRLANKKVPLFYQIVEFIDKKLSTDNRSSKAIRSFKYDNDNNEGIRLYFEEGHPVRTHIELTQNK
jgi:hypothetical protein